MVDVIHFPLAFPLEFRETWPCSITIGGAYVNVLNGTISIDKHIEERSTASFTVQDVAGTGNYVRGQIVEIYDGVPTLTFAGFIADSVKSRISPTALVYSVTCMDNHYLADKRLVKGKSYTNRTAGYIATDIFTDYLAGEGVTIGAIQDGPIIKDITFNYVKVSVCLDKLKELSGFTWYIDSAKALYFIDRATNTAPWQLDGVTHQSLEGSENLSIGNSMYRNSQYSRGGTGTTTLQTETITGDGETRSFALGFPLALVPTITEGITPKSVGIKGIDTAKAYYWSKGDNVIYADVAPGVGVVVSVQYYGQFPLMSQVINAGAILVRKAIEGGSGIVEDIVTETQHESSDASTDSARGKILQYCQEAEKFQYSTNEAGLFPGQLQAITSAPFGFTAHEMLIESVLISADGDVITYNISCITGPAMGSWARFFSSLLRRQDDQIRVGDNLMLILLQQMETLNLAEVTSIATDEFGVSGNVNRWLNAPPINAGSLDNIQHERLKMTEVGSESHHTTQDYKWDAADALWDFATWL